MCVCRSFLVRCALSCFHSSVISYQFFSISEIFIQRHKYLLSISLVGNHLWKRTDATSTYLLQAVPLISLPSFQMRLQSLLSLSVALITVSANHDLTILLVGSRYKLTEQRVSAQRLKILADCESEKVKEIVSRSSLCLLT